MKKPGILQKTENGVILRLTLRSSITLVPFDGVSPWWCFYDTCIIL